MGPRHTSGLSPGFSSPIEITLMPYASTGTIVFSSSIFGCSLVPSITGTFGPYTSASSNPTDAPIVFSAIARFTATVVLRPHALRHRSVELQFHGRHARHLRQRPADILLNRFAQRACRRRQRDEQRH